MSIQTAIMRSDTDPETPEIAVGMIVVPAKGLEPLPVNALPGILNTYQVNQYGFAIVVQMSPLVLVSELGDMRWSQLSLKDANNNPQFVAVGKANAATMAIVNTRLAE